MLRVGIFMAAVLWGAVLSLQVVPRISPQNPIPTVWEMSPTLPTGIAMPLVFELKPTGVFIDGPRVVVPCVGESEEANLKGWRDDSVEWGELAPDFLLRSAVQRHFKVGRDSGHRGREIIRNEQTRIEMLLTQMYNVKPGEGSGPRENEQIFRYRYQKMTLTVRMGNEPFLHKLSVYYVPMAQPVLESTRPCGATPKETACSMGGFGVQSSGSVASYTLPPVDRKEIGYVGAVIDVDVAEQIKTSGFEVSGVDINSASVGDASFADVPKLHWIYLPTGTVLVPGKAGIQSMITVDPLLLTRGTLETLSAGEILEKTIAVHCLEMDKQPPDPSVKFSFGRVSDPVLRNLATFTQKSAIKGPWDQARLWIYTDKSSLERINKRLAIGCPPGMYVRSLWEVQTMGGMSDKDLANAEFFKPEYLGAVSNRKEAAAWFGSVLANRHRAALIQYLAAGGKEFAGLVTSTNPLASDQFARTIGQLLAHESAEVRIATLKFLDAQDAAALKKAMGKPALKWDRHLEEEGAEAEVAKSLQTKLG